MGNVAVFVVFANCLNKIVDKIVVGCDVCAGMGKSRPLGMANRHDGNKAVTAVNH